MDRVGQELAQFPLDGLQWVTETSFEGPLREAIAPHLAGLESAGATLIKRSLARATYRLELPGRTVFVKHHKARSWKERLKYLVLPSRASAEWKTSRAMAEHGIPAARALAFGERRIAGVFCEAVLVSEAVEDAMSLGRALREKGEPPGRVARFIRRMHDADVLHRDLHGGNILVAGGELVLIDLHRVTVGGPLSGRRRVASVAQFLAPLGDCIGQEARLTFVREYLGPEAEQAEVDRFASSVEKAAARWLERRYASRTRRCIKRSTGFRREHLPGLKVYRRAEFPPEVVAGAIELHRATTADRIADGILKCDDRTRVTVVDVGDKDHPQHLCVKEFIRGGLLQRINDIFRGSRARLAWLGSNACEVRGIRTPKAHAMAEAGPRSFLITDFVDGAVSLNWHASDFGRPHGREATRKWRAFVREAADFVRLLHSHDLRHRDLAGKNILVREKGGGWEFYLVDVGDIRTGRTPSLSYRIKNLGQLDQVCVRPSRTDRLRFYRHYSRGRPELNRRELLLEIDAISRARQQRWLECGGREILEERKQQGKPA